MRPGLRRERTDGGRADGAVRPGRAICAGGSCQLPVAQFRAATAGAQSGARSGSSSSQVPQVSDTRPAGKCVPATTVQVPAVLGKATAVCDVLGARFGTARADELVSSSF